MRLAPTVLIFSFLLFGSEDLVGQHADEDSLKSVDRAVLENIFSLYGASEDRSTSDLMIVIAAYFAESPYAEQSLEKEPEQLIVNLREFDCTTFMESCLAISRTIRSGKLSYDQYLSHLQNIRYREGIINGYTSRIHYFSDWIYLSGQKGITKDISEEIGASSYDKEINFMSTHPSSYRQLKSDPSLIEIIREQEQVLSARQMHFISEDRIADLEPGLKDGDIVGITTNIEGLDVLHVGILQRKDGIIHLWHASSRLGKVVLSEETLETYLVKSKTATGIMVARPL